MSLPHPQTTPSIFLVFFTGYYCWEGEVFFQSPFLIPDILQYSLQ